MTSFRFIQLSGGYLQCNRSGVHLKTAGTTWFEELIGSAEAGGDGLQLVRDVYQYAIEHRDELCGPYATVIDINSSKLLSVEDFAVLSVLTPPQNYSLYPRRQPV